jgi:hypothetical protein
LGVFWDNLWMFNGDFQNYNQNSGGDFSIYEPFDEDRYEFPYILAPKIGLRKEQIGFLKKLGCPFLGKKTTLRILREFAKERAFFESCERAKKSRPRW